MKTVRVLPWTLALLLAFGLAGGSGAAPCEGCFALVVLPDTQGYTELRSQPEGAARETLEGMEAIVVDIRQSEVRHEDLVTTPG